MKKSFSWKTTQPLRFLRRQLIDPLKNYRISKIQSRATQKSYQDWIKKYDTITRKKSKILKNSYRRLEDTPLFFQ